MQAMGRSRTRHCGLEIRWLVNTGFSEWVVLEESSRGRVGGRPASVTGRYRRLHGPGH